MTTTEYRIHAADLRLLFTEAFDAYWEGERLSDPSKEAMSKFTSAHDRMRDLYLTNQAVPTRPTRVAVPVSDLTFLLDGLTGLDTPAGDWARALDACLKNALRPWFGTARRWSADDALFQARDALVATRHDADGIRAMWPDASRQYLTRPGQDIDNEHMTTDTYEIDNHLFAYDATLLLKTTSALDSEGFSRGQFLMYTKARKALEDAIYPAGHTQPGSTVERTAVDVLVRFVTARGDAIDQSWAQALLDYLTARTEDSAQTIVDAARANLSNKRVKVIASLGETARYTRLWPALKDSLESAPRPILAVRPPASAPPPFVPVVDENGQPAVAVLMTPNNGDGSQQPFAAYTDKTALDRAVGLLNAASPHVELTEVIVIPLNL
jgi:hypothetical protein